MENYLTTKIENERQCLGISFGFGLKSEIATLLSPLPSRPKGT